MLKPALAMVLASMFTFACSAAPASSTSDKNVSESKNGKDGADSSASAASAATGGSALDGTWDLTSETLAGSSQITVKGGSITGALVGSSEGQSVDGCTVTKDRIEFSLTISGDKLSGTAKTVNETSGPADQCFSGGTSTSTITGKRAAKAANAKGKTVLEGDWEVTVDGGSPIVGTVTGLSAEIWDKTAKANNEGPGFGAEATSTQITASGGPMGDIAARKR